MSHHPIRELRSDVRGVKDALQAARLTLTTSCSHVLGAVSEIESRDRERQVLEREGGKGREREEGKGA